MLMDNWLDEIMVETLKDDRHDRWNHHEQTFVDEDEEVVDESLHFGRITKNKNFEIFFSFHQNNLRYVEMDDQLVEHWNWVVEKMVDNILHVLVDLEYYRVLLVESVIVVVVEFDSTVVHLVVDLTSFDYLNKM
jgi:hypothetical protein